MKKLGRRLSDGGFDPMESAVISCALDYYQKTHKMAALPHGESWDQFAKQWDNTVASLVNQSNQEVDWDEE